MLVQLHVFGYLIVSDPASLSRCFAFVFLFSPTCNRCSYWIAHTSRCMPCATSRPETSSDSIIKSAATRPEERREEIGSAGSCSWLIVIVFVVVCLNECTQYNVDKQDAGPTFVCHCEEKNCERQLACARKRNMPISSSYAELTPMCADVCALDRRPHPLVIVEFVFCVGVGATQSTCKHMQHPCKSNSLGRARSSSPFLFLMSRPSSCIACILDSHIQRLKLKTIFVCLG